MFWGRAGFDPPWKRRPRRGKLTACSSGAALAGLCAHVFKHLVEPANGRDRRSCRDRAANGIRGRETHGTYHFPSGCAWPPRAICRAHPTRSARPEPEGPLVGGGHLGLACQHAFMLLAQLCTRRMWAQAGLLWVSGAWATDGPKPATDINKSDGRLLTLKFASCVTSLMPRMRLFKIRAGPRRSSTSERMMPT